MFVYNKSMFFGFFKKYKTVMVGIIVVLLSCFFDTKARTCALSAVTKNLSDVECYTINLVLLERVCKRSPYVKVDDFTVTDKSLEEVSQILLKYLENKVDLTNVRKKIILQPQVKLKNGVTHQIDEIEVLSSSTHKIKYRNRLIENVMDKVWYLFSVDSKPEISFLEALLTGALILDCISSLVSIFSGNHRHHYYHHNYCYTPWFYTPPAYVIIS